MSAMKVFMFVCLCLIMMVVDFADSEERPKMLKHHRTRHSRAMDLSNRFGSQLPKLAVKDNHKPIFKDCFNYRPSVKEEQPIGTYIFTVKADDQDPSDQGGTVNYKFVTSPGEKERFYIDPETGRITTKDIFDHDEPSREKEVYITVRVSDNGQPQLDDACTIKIIIEDINDNPPVFDKVSYSESVPQDLPAGREVMRLSATDIDDGNNSIVTYKLDTNSPDQKYFFVDPQSGVIFLNKTIDKPPGHKFYLSAIVQDMGNPRLQSSMTLDISVVESNKKSPSFIEYTKSPIQLKENYSEFKKPIAFLSAESNIPGEPKVQFELVPGQTEQTNKWHTFILEPEGESAVIKLGGHLDYEKITEYIVTVRIQNNYRLAAEVPIVFEILDVNDNIPIFSEIHSGSVLENEPPGTVVMQVRAIDYDGTSANNNITYELGDPTDPFAIDPYTGNITTLKTFDREEQAFYNLKVVATDNSDSALTPGKHNSGVQVFLIEIADKNDNRPEFTSDTYVAEAIPENANINELVTQVTALDNDTASLVSYSIVNGNIGDAFSISPLTGEVRVNKQLDYETISQYVLDVRAFDGIYEDYAKVLVKLENLNDNPPVFVANYTKTIEEERLYDGCIVQVEAYDPDLTDRNAPQNIAYALVKQEQQEYLTIDNDGCLKLTKPLDRDPPTGFEQWQILIMAADHNGKLTDSLRATTEVILVLTDINDNAPFLTNTQPVVWYENEEPGKIISLNAKDNDGPENGAPFFYALKDTTHETYTKFSISGNQLMALVRFDREEKKEYHIPITITDSGSPRMSGVSVMTVIIGDRNDNPMEAGSSSVFAYNYRGKAPDMEIGRVYVNDPDDWDLPDKKFLWRNPADVNHPHFDVSDETGMITMRSGTLAGNYFLEFTVSEENNPLIPLHYVDATVNVTVKEIPEEAVDKSGSIRFLNGSPEEFVVTEADGTSKKDKLHQRIATIFNVSRDNVDVFTVLKKVNVKNLSENFLDVRFSVHGSPYYPPEKLNYITEISKAKIEDDLKLKIYMVHIDECLLEKEQCEDACRNVLTKSNVPASVFTNHTSFIGVSAIVESECSCEIYEPRVCLNGGTAVGDRCECPAGHQGPRCEVTSMGFHGNGYAMFPAPPMCPNNHISLMLTTGVSEGLIFYQGPLHYNDQLKVQDFVSLEIKDGYPHLLMDYGTGTTRLNNTVVQLSDNKPHLIEILTTKSSIEMFVDRCKLTTCMSLGAPTGTNEMLNVVGNNTCKICYSDPDPGISIPRSQLPRSPIVDHPMYTGRLASGDLPTRRDPSIPNPLWPMFKVAGPLVLGGAPVDLRGMAVMHGWKYTPSVKPLMGCISNFTINKHVIDLGAPSMQVNAKPGCDNLITAGAVSFSINSNFLIAILVCIGILIVLLLAVVVHRRRSDTWAEKELDDIRENIIAYEDEGGGEGDAGYDLHVLRQMYEGRPPEADRYMHTGLVAAAPDISGILDDKKSVLDRDADVNPLDDVRHYAYEGDGNSTGSLSSLASSGTEDGDQNFDFLMNYGAPFKKLVDMYGDADPRDRDSQLRNDSRGPNEESWC